MLLLLLPPALAQDAVKLEILRTGQQGTADPALVVLPQQAIASLDVAVQCGGVTQQPALESFEGIVDIGPSQIEICAAELCEQALGGEETPDALPADLVPPSKR